MFKKNAVLLLCLLSLISAISYSAYSMDSPINLEQDKLPPEMGIRTFNDLGREELCTLRLTSLSWKEIADTLIQQKRLLNILFTPQTIEERNLDALKSIGPLATSICIAKYEGHGDNITKLIQLFDEKAFSHCFKLLLVGNEDFGLCDNEYNLYKIIKNLPTIRELVLLGNQLNMLSVLQAASKSCLKQLQSLHLIINEVDDLQLFLIASCAVSGCFEKLTKLDLRGNNITLDGLRYLACIPPNCLPELTDIDISMNEHLNTTEVLNTTQGRTVIETILKNNPKISVFNMMHQGINKYFIRSLNKSFPSVTFSFPNISYIGGFLKPEQLLGYGVEVFKSIFGAFSHVGDDSSDSESDSDSDGCVLQ